MKVPQKRRRLAVARVLAGETTCRDEAQRLGVDQRTVERWVAAARAAQASTAAPMPPVSSPAVSSPGAAPPDDQAASAAAEGEPEAYRAALEAAGETPAASGASQPGPTPEEMLAAKMDLQEMALDAVRQIKSAILAGIVIARYSPPLDPTDQDLAKYYQLGPLAEVAVRANSQLVLDAVKWLSQGRYQVGAALLFDVILSIASVRRLAIERGWQAEAKGKTE